MSYAYLNKLIKKIGLVFFFLVFTLKAFSQDSLATRSEIDTAIINTIVIRKTQERMAKPWL